MDLGATLSTVVRNDLHAFTQGAFRVLIGKPFEANWHHQAMTHVAEQMIAGARRRQIITVPPRSLKSILFSVALPAFVLGHDPTAEVMVVSYSEPLAEQLSDLTRRLMQSEYYQATFSDVKLRQQSSLLLKTSAGGQRFATTIGGAVTGFGGDWIIVDDPHNALEANSSPARERVANFFQQSLLSRANDETTARFLLVMQRLHADDVAGRLLADGGWPQLKLQARADVDVEVEIGPGVFHPVQAGDLMHPRRLPQAVLDDKMRQMGSANFQAQYQQEPVPAGGNMIKREWLVYYDEVPDRAGGEIILSLDTAAKTNLTNDYSACSVWLKRPEASYLLHVWRARVDYPTLRHKVLELYGAYTADGLLIEDAGSGMALIQELRSQGMPIIACKPRGTKEARLAAASRYAEAGLIRLPRRDVEWKAVFETEFLGFPSTRHDDQVDTVSQYFAWVQEREGGFLRYDDGRNDPPEVADGVVPGFSHDDLASALLDMRWS